MRFVVLSKRDLFGNLALNGLLPILRRNHEVNVFLSDRIFPDERCCPPANAYMRHTRDHLLDVFFPAVDALPSGGDAEALTFSGLAAKYDVAIADVGGDEGPAIATMSAAIRSRPPDVLLCCRHDFIIPPSVYSVARHGAYNMHSGPLPDYRGPFSVFWTMYNRERETACTIHTLKAAVDTGDIICQSRVTLDYGASLVHNLVRIYAGGVDALSALLPSLEKGRLRGQAQQKQSGRYYPQPDAERCLAFVRNGGKFSDDEEYESILKRYSVLINH